MATGAAVTRGSLRAWPEQPPSLDAWRAIGEDRHGHALPSSAGGRSGPAIPGGKAVSPFRGWRGPTPTPGLPSSPEVEAVTDRGVIRRRRLSPAPSAPVDGASVDPSDPADAVDAGRALFDGYVLRDEGTDGPADQIRQASGPQSAPWRAPRHAPRRWRGPSPKRRVQRSRRVVAVAGVRGGTAPRQPLRGTHEVWPRRVCWLSHLSGVRKARSRQPQMPRIKRAASAFRRAHARRGSRLELRSHLGSGAKLRQVACSIKQSSENRPCIHFLESGPSSSVPALASGKASPYAL